jgi:hypothetical protein
LQACSCLHCKIQKTATNTVICLNNLKQIGASANYYAADYGEHWIARRLNWCELINRAEHRRNNEFEPLNAFTDYGAAYWGMSYFDYLGGSLDSLAEVFSCPEAETEKITDKGNSYFEYDHKYGGRAKSYTFNGALPGNVLNGIGLQNPFFLPPKDNSGEEFVKILSKPERLDRPSKTILSHDSYEVMIEADDDIPYIMMPNTGALNKKIEELRRHNWKVATVWADGHTALIDEEWKLEWYQVK